MNPFCLDPWEEEFYKEHRKEQNSLFLGRMKEHQYRIIGKVLAHSETLKQVFFEDTLNGNCMKHIAEALKVNKSISELFINKSEISDDAMQYLCEALYVNNKLSELNLLSSTVSERGIKYLSDALKVNGSLTKVDLGSNKSFTERSARYILEALKMNRMIKAINLSGNEMIGELKLEIQALLNENKKEIIVAEERVKKCLKESKEIKRVLCKIIIVT